MKIVKINGKYKVHTRNKDNDCNFYTTLYSYFILRNYYKLKHLIYKSIGYRLIMNKKTSKLDPVYCRYDFVKSIHRWFYCKLVYNLADYMMNKFNKKYAGNEWRKLID